MTFNDAMGRQVYLFMGLYPVQKQGEELINDLNRISDNKIWFSGYQRAKLYDTGGRQVFEQLLKHNGGEQRLVWYWYHVAGHNTVNRYHAKALQALGLITGSRQAAVIAVASKLDEEPETTRKILRQFAAAVNPVVGKIMDAGSDAK